MIDFLLYVFKYWVHDFGFISSALFLVLWSRLNKIETWVGLLIFWCFFVDLFAAGFAFKSSPNQWIYNLGIPVQILLITIVYCQLFSSLQIKKYLIIGYCTYFILYFLDLFFLQKFDQLNTYVYIPVCICVSTVSYLYIKGIVDNPDAKIFDNYFFWFASAMLINYTATVPLIALLTWPGISDPVWNKIYYLNNIIDCSWFAIIGFGLAWTKRQTSFSL